MRHMKACLYHSGTRYRTLKRQQFNTALDALDHLEEGSIRLPENVCRRIWQAVQEVKQARQDWLFQHHEQVHITPGTPPKLTSGQIIRDTFLQLMQLSRQARNTPTAFHIPHPKRTKKSPKTKKKIQ